MCRFEAQESFSDSSGHPWACPELSDTPEKELICNKELISDCLCRGKEYPPKASVTVLPASRKDSPFTDAMTGAKPVQSLIRVKTGLKQSGSTAHKPVIIANITPSRCLALQKGDKLLPGTNILLSGLAC